MTTRPMVLLLNRMLHPAGEEVLSASAAVRTVSDQAPHDELEQALRAADGLVVRLPWRITREFIERVPRVRVIATAGAGVDNIDVTAATAAGIPVVNNAGIGPLPVAEHAVGMMLALLRRITAGDRRLRSEGWACRETLLGAELGTELTGKTIGVVGFGFIGRQVAGILRAGFQARILAYDPLLADEVFTHAGVERRLILGDLLSESDVVTLHVPLADATRHLIGRAELRKMKSTAFLINCARGAIVNEAALVQALREGWIAGAGIDVFDPEPPPPGAPLLGLENAVVTPHIAGLSQETNRRLSIAAAEQVLQVLAGKRPPRLVNPEVWDRRRDVPPWR